MNRKQRIRCCGNLLQLLETAPSDKLRQVYRSQLNSTKKALNGVGAVQSRTN